MTRPDDELTATGDLLHALGDADRLRIITQLLDRPRKLDELAEKSNLSPFEVRHQLDRFRSTGVLVVTGQEPDTVFSIRSDLRHVLVQLLAIMESTPVTKASEPAATPEPSRT